MCIVDSEISVVIWRGHFHDIHRDDVRVENDLAHDPKQVDWGETAGRWGAGCRSEGRVQNVDVYREVDRVGAIECLGNDILHDVLHATLPDLLHRMMAKAVLAHPLLIFLTRPVPAQPDLNEVVAGDRAGLDKAPHWRSVTREVSVDLLGGVCVSVKVDHADLAEPMVLGDSSRGRPGDGVVTPKDDWNDATARDLRHSLVDRGPRGLPHSVAHDGIAIIDHLQVVEHLDLQVKVIGAWVVCVCAHGTRPEAGAGAVRRVVVPWGADDCDIRLPLV